MDHREEEKGDEQKKKLEDEGSEEALIKKQNQQQQQQQQLNAEAPEFVPRGRPRPPPPPPPQIVMPMPIPIPIQAAPYYNYYHQHHAVSNGYGSINNNNVALYDAYGVVNSPIGDYPVDARNSGGSNSSSSSNSSKKGSMPDANQKILNQVEFYFSDINLATTDQLFKHMSKDPEGYVPLSVVASFKKIKAAINGSMDLANILRSSKKLLVSEDGKKVKRQHPLSESDMEELQSRIVIAENLPDDHSHQNLMKIFSSIGSVKSIRTCPPQNSSNGSSSSKTGKGDGMQSSGKFHAFVEYESVELAERAVVELTDEGNWRNGLKVRLLLNSVPKPTQMRARKVAHEGQAIGRKDDTTSGEMLHLKESCFEDSSTELALQIHENQVENNTTNNTQKKERRHTSGNSNNINANNTKGKGKGKGKGHGRGRNHHALDSNSVLGCPQIEVPVGNDKVTISRTSPVPRMPDGTKGFSMGRGKSVSVKVT